MRLNDFIEEQTIVEVPMNPSAFAAAIDTGQEQGVRVGFEFEVYVPESLYVGTDTKTVPTTTQEFIKKFNDLDYLDVMSPNEFSPENFDTYFKFKQPINGFNSTQQAYDVLLKKNIVKAKKLFNKIDEAKRITMIRRAKKSGLLSGNSADNQLKFILSVGNELTLNYGNEYNIGRGLIKLASINWRDISEVIFAPSGFISYMSFLHLKRNFNNLFELTKTPEETYHALNMPQVEAEEDYDIDDDDANYPLATEKLKPLISSVMGAKVTVFNDYHERKKNTTNWYIEPDGSLSMQEEAGDVGVEIVSPPLPAITAIDALKKFFALAQQNKFYTNKSTGLHINVSIPQKLDILKLAVFLGDQYVMRYFNRENNKYVSGAMRGMNRDIRRNADPLPYVDVKTSREPGVLNQPNQTSNFNMSALQILANNNSGDHNASISNNGKYISFRHAGGDYLADYSGIYNTVGRFIRAMIIASTPELYAQEYKTKIAKLLAQAQPEIQRYGPIDKVIAYLRKNGLPIIELDIMKISARKNMNNAIKDALFEILDTAPGNSITIQQNNQDSKNNIVNLTRGEVVKEKIKNAPLTEFAKTTVLPEELRDLIHFVNKTTSTGVNTFNNPRRSYEVAGYYYLDKIMLPPTDPRTQAFIKKMLKKQYTQR